MVWFFIYNCSCFHSKVLCDALQALVYGEIPTSLSGVKKKLAQVLLTLFRPRVLFEKYHHDILSTAKKLRYESGIQKKGGEV